MTQAEWTTIRDALEAAWTHINRTIEIAEGDNDPPEDLDVMHADLRIVEAAQGLVGRTLR